MTKAAIIATQKNEGIFLVEWIAYHLAIGFDRIFICYNGCQDGSDVLIARIAEKFPVTIIDNTNPVGERTIQASANHRCLTHPLIEGIDWVLHIDVDEFFLPESDDVGAFLSKHASSEVIAVWWKLFGNNSRKNWDGGLVTEAFDSGARTPTDGPIAHKSFFRPHLFRESSPHLPKADSDTPENVVFVDASGKAIDNAIIYAPRGTVARIAPETVSWQEARINHYMIKSLDLVEMKLRRGDANGRRQRKRRIWTPEFNTYNVNIEKDSSIERFRSAKLAKMDEILRHREIYSAQIDCFMWFYREKAHLSHFANLDEDV